jgi:hypothetical protein
MPGIRPFLTSLVAIAICGASLVVAPAVASANSCNTIATGSWSNNCTVSQGNASHMVEVVQMIVQAQEICAPDIRNVDGRFGPMTFLGVECFQSFFHLHRDGIVGPQTWGALQHALFRCSASGGWQYWSPISACAATLADWINTGVWHFLSPISRTWHRMDTSPPS